MVECSKEAVRDGLGAESVRLCVFRYVVDAYLVGNSERTVIVACLMGRGE
jgi:hypothetical protein